MSFLSSSMFPLVQRELLSQARAKSVYGLRFIVVLLFGSIVGYMGMLGIFRELKGSHVFGTLTYFLFYSLTLLTPLLASSCITTERENGTLGLLFQSSLSSLDVVMGKFTSNMLRLLSIGISGFPVFAGCLLLGGITGSMLGGVGLVILSLLISGIAFSTLASAISNQSRTAGFLSFCYMIYSHFGIWFFLEILKSEYMLDFTQWSPVLSSSACLYDQFSWGGGRPLDLAWKCLGRSVVEGVIYLSIATWWLPRSLAWEGVGGRRNWKFLRFRKWLVIRSLLEIARRRNVIRWMEYRKISLGHGIMMMGLVTVIILGLTLEDWKDVMDEGGFFMGIPLRILLDVVVLGEVCREIITERRERHLELILCSPLEVKELVGARLRGIFHRYGSLYLLTCAPGLMMMDRLFSNDISFERQFFMPMEYFEDFTFLFMLVLISINTALKARSATNAILLVFMKVGLGYLVWGFFSIFLMQEMQYREWGFVLIISSKVIVEILVGAWQWRSILSRMREQSTVPVQM